MFIEYYLIGAFEISYPIVSFYHMHNLYFQTITQSGTFSLRVGEIAGNDSDASVAKGEGKRFIVDVVLPESTTQKIVVSFLTPVLTTGQVEICDAAIISVGSHFPCIDKKTITPTFQSR